MDAFSVSLANGMNDRCMRQKKALFIAALFALFQGAMPLIGYTLVNTVVKLFESFKVAIPFIALGLLTFIGIKMIIDGAKKQDDSCPLGLGIGALLLQAVATSIDALSVGFTIADYKLPEALIAVGIIGLITFMICYGGVNIGKAFGNKLSSKSQIFGGIILILVGIEIFVTGIIELF
jgi:putative Mn2+ efflux pump MntP